VVLAFSGAQAREEWRRAIIVRSMSGKPPTWLRNERSYRLYVRGLRYALLGAVVAAVCGVLAASGVIGVQVPVAGFLAGLATSFLSVVCGIVGWLKVPDKKRVEAQLGAFLRMAARDVLTGRIPPGPQPRTMQDLADQIRPHDCG